MTPTHEYPLKAVAEIFHVSERTIKNWIDTLGFPRPYYIGRKPFFRGIDLIIWKEQQQKNTEPPPKEPEPMTEKTRK